MFQVFLKLMDKAAKSPNVVILGTTNQPCLVDARIRSRMEIIKIRRPGEKDRQAILKVSKTFMIICA